MDSGQFDSAGDRAKNYLVLVAYFGAALAIAGFTFVYARRHGAGTFAALFFSSFFGAIAAHAPFRLAFLFRQQFLRWRAKRLARNKATPSD